LANIEAAAAKAQVESASCLASTFKPVSEESLSANFLSDPRASTTARSGFRQDMASAIKTTSSSFRFPLLFLTLRSITSGGTTNRTDLVIEVTLGANASLLRGVRALESFTPMESNFPFMPSSPATAAMTMGPTTGPLPASSTPASINPSTHRISSCGLFRRARAGIPWLFGNRPP